jgi:hypothetical protein
VETDADTKKTRCSLTEDEKAATAATFWFQIIKRHRFRNSR